MTNGRQDPDRGVLADAEKTRYRVMLESIYKFRFFFVGLIFAILSFAIQFRVKTNHLCVKLIEVSSWGFLVIAGFFAIKDCGGFASKQTEKVVEGIGPKQRKVMWITFFLAICLLLVSKISDVFYSV